MQDRESARGERLLQARKFSAAEAAFRAALKRSPDNPSVWLRVADCAFLRRDMSAAAKAAARAHELGGGPDLLRRRLQAVLLARDEAGARRVLAAPGLPVGEVLFWRGVLSARARKWNAARTLFLSSVQAAPGRLAVRAGLLAAWAAHRDAVAPPDARGRGVVVVGLGWKRPRQATVGGLDALASCARLFVVANTVDDEVRDLLCLFRARVSPVVFRGSETEAARAAGLAVAAGAKGRAGTVTRGNPLVYGRFAARLVSAAEERGVPVEVFPGVSAFEGLAAEETPAPGAPLGLELRGGFSLGDAGTRRPVLAFAPSALSGRKTLAAALTRAARGAMVRVLTSEGPSAAQSSRLSSSAAAAALRAASAPAMLMWTPRRTRR